MNRSELISDLVRDEGLRLAAYRDTKGLLTIGIGRCLDTNPLTPEECEFVGHDGRRLPITEAQAHYLCANDIKRVSLRLSRNLSWWSRQPEAIQRALANMAFNLGVPGLLSFRNTLGAMERGDYAAAAAGMRGSLWAHQVKDRAERLARMVESCEKEKAA